MPAQGAADRPRASNRVPALDVLRGAAVAGMILVTSPGDWNSAYAQLRHADWNGWTLADMVFPTFLFAVGMAVGLSFPRPWSNEARRQAWLRVARRTAALILLGLFLAWVYVAAISAGASFPGHGGLANIRIPGVVQRIALCYLMGAVLIFSTVRTDSEGRAHVRQSAVAIAIIAVLLLYWAVMNFVPVPGVGAGHLDPAGNLAGYVDRQVFTIPHLWPLGWAIPGGPVYYDPEGLLSTFPATVNLLFGVLAAREWQRSPNGAVLRIALAGLVLFAAGLLLDPLFVINKRIWTSSFALLSSGFSACALAGLALLLRDSVAARLMTPLRVLGGNAVLAFTLSMLLGNFGGLPFIRQDGRTMSPQGWADAQMLRIVPDPYLASLACAIGILALITLALWPLHRRAIHFRF